MSSLFCMISFQKLFATHEELEAASNERVRVGRQIGRQVARVCELKRSVFDCSQPNVGLEPERRRAGGNHEATTLLSFFLHDIFMSLLP
jgi:hypothetical protein